MVMAYYGGDLLKGKRHGLYEVDPSFGLPKMAIWREELSGDLCLKDPAVDENNTLSVPAQWSRRVCIETMPY